MPTVTDGELIFEVYRKYGSECVHLLRGLWSFAVWDAEQNAAFWRATQPEHRPSIGGTLAKGWFSPPG
jgi:hypothetical protein